MSDRRIVVWSSSSSSFRSDPLMRKIRYLDKLVDDLAKGTKMASILRSGVGASSAF